MSITPMSPDQQPGDDQNMGQFSVKTSAPRGSDLGDIQHFDIYFMREPHSVLDAAMAEAQARNLPVFAVVYDAGHPQQSNTGAECLVSRSTH